MLGLFMFLIFLLIVPTAVGILIKCKKPTIADKIVKYLRPTTFVVLLLLLAVGIYVNLYVIKLLSQAAWQLVVACTVLPAVAMAICALSTFLLCQPWKQMKTICIEVAVQNSAIPLLVLRASMEQPDADLSSVPSMLVTISVSFYLVILALIHIIHKKCCRKSDPDTKSLDKLETPKYDTVIQNNHADLNNINTDIDTVTSNITKVLEPGFIEPESFQTYL